jgi:uncharacterized membrane protein
MSDTLASGSRRPSVLRIGRALEAPGPCGPGGDVPVQWQMQRNCSLAPRQLIGVYLSLCVVSSVIALGFWAQGALLVLPIAWIELTVVGVALLVYARHAGDRESIRLEDGRLTVEQQWGSRTLRVDFQPAWVRVEPESADRSLVELSGQGRRVVVGRHIRPELRRQLADEIRWALRHPRGWAAAAV